MGESEALLRIGELSRRVGVGPDRLRAWERRYGLLRPVRTAGGFRLYSADDERRIRDMLAQLGRGLSAAEAARAVLAAEAFPPHTPLDDLRGRLATALAGFDEAGAHAVLDHLFAIHGPDVTMRDVVYPYLRALGEAWESAEIDVGHEHFASNVLHGRLFNSVSSWEEGRGPRAVLACPSGEHHSLGLVGLGVGLRNRGWRVTYLGADTPIANVARTVKAVAPQVVVLSATMPNSLAPHEDELRALAGSVRLLLAGAGVAPGLAERVGAESLDADPVSAAEHLAAG